MAIFAAPGAHALELGALKDVFSLANEKLEPEARYEVCIVVDDVGTPFICSSGLQMLGDAGLFQIGKDIDTLIISGSDPQAIPSDDLLDWLRTQALVARRWGAMGAGAFALGAAGLLDGRRATTHWQYADALAEGFPAATIDRERIYVRDGPLVTCAGGSAAIDLALALIEEDHGRELALDIAHKLIIYLKRAGTDPQHSVQLTAQSSDSGPVARVQAWIRDHAADNLSIKQLAKVAAMSVRNFARVFKREVGVGPAAFVELTRVDNARRLLSDSDLPLQQVAIRSGFSNNDAARRAFRRHVGLSPAQYRMLNRHR